VTIRLFGEFDYSNAHDIDDVVSSALGHAPTSIVLDLDGAELVSAAALGAVVRSRNTCRRRGVPLTVHAEEARLRRLFTITGLEALLLATGSPDTAPVDEDGASPVTHVGPRHRITLHPGDAAADLEPAV
jgi:anti-anti-sigma factor